MPVKSIKKKYNSVKNKKRKSKSKKKQKILRRSHKRKSKKILKGGVPEEIKIYNEQYYAFNDIDLQNDLESSSYFHKKSIFTIETYIYDLIKSELPLDKKFFVIFDNDNSIYCLIIIHKFHVYDRIIDLTIFQIEIYTENIYHYPKFVVLNYDYIFETVCGYQINLLFYNQEFEFKFNETPIFTISSMRVYPYINYIKNIKLDNNLLIYKQGQHYSRLTNEEVSGINFQVKDLTIKHCSDYETQYIHENNEHLKKMHLKDGTKIIYLIKEINGDIKYVIKIKNKGTNLLQINGKIKYIVYNDNGTQYKFFKISMLHPELKQTKIFGYERKLYDTVYDFMHAVEYSIKYKLKFVTPVLNELSI